MWYFLWGYLKSTVYTHQLENLQALKDAIRREIAAIPPAMTERVMRAFRNRLEECIANDGHHLGDIIFKTRQKLLYISFLVLQWNFLYLYWFYRINVRYVVLLFGSPCIKQEQGCKHNGDFFQYAMKTWCKVAKFMIFSFRFLNFYLCGKLENTVLHIEPSHRVRTSIWWLFPLAQQTTHHLVGFFFDVPGIMSGKQHPRRREGLGDFDERPLVADSTTPPIEDKLSAVSRKSKLDMLSPFFLYMMNAFRQSTSRRQRNIFW